MSGHFDISELSVKETAERIAKDPAIRLIDVRTDEEYATAKIPGALLVNSEAHLEEIMKMPKNTPLIIHCHHGMRSLSAAGFFLQRGFTEVYSMAGGIDAWSAEIDASIPRY